MKSNFTCAVSLVILLLFLIIFTPLILIYSHLQELDEQTGRSIRKSDEKDDPLLSESETTEDYSTASEIDKYITGRPCTQFEYWCQSSVEETICIDARLRCNSKRDCPKVDVSSVININYNVAHEILMKSSVAPDDHIEPFHLTPDDIHSTQSPEIENFTEIRAVTTRLPNVRHPNHPTSNCSFAGIASGACDPCDFSHNASVICRKISLKSIPPNLVDSIKVLNLDNNEIENLEGVNTYRQMVVLSLRNNSLSSLKENTFDGMPFIRRLYLSNNRIRDINANAFSGLHNLRRLYLAFNQLKSLEFSSLRHTPSLLLLDLSFNRLSALTPFPSLNHLQWLDLEGNFISDLDCEGGSPFAQLSMVRMLSLKHNRLTHISSGCFTFNSNMLELDLGHNWIESIDSEAFRGLSRLTKLSLRSLNLTGVEINNINPKMFTFEGNLTHLYFSRFRYCMYAPQVRSCRPFSDGLSSIHHLLVHPILRKSVWAVALFTCIGNLLVIIWRTISSKEDQVLSLFVQNLSVSDFLMGVYLLTIASYDYVYEDKYALYALEWTRSWKCSFCGALAMISSELSVLVLTLITIERYKCITAEFRVVTASSAKINLVITWFIAICLAIFPLIYWKGEPYYGSSSGLCFPLHIYEPYNLGWQYSAFVIIGINLTAVIVIAILYWKMFSTIKSDRKFARPALPEEKKKREDAILAFRFFAIVSTDCLCWLPIATIKLIAFTSLTISPTLNAWLVVFILPINSALNPVIYTLAAPTELHHRLYKQFRRAVFSLKESILSSQRETLDESGESVKVVCNEVVSRSPSVDTMTTNGGHNLGHLISPNTIIQSADETAACRVENPEGRRLLCPESSVHDGPSLGDDLSCSPSAVMIQNDDLIETVHYKDAFVRGRGATSPSKHCQGVCSSSSSIIENSNNESTSSAHLKSGCDLTERRLSKVSIQGKKNMNEPLSKSHLSEIASKIHDSPMEQAKIKSDDTSRCKKFHLLKMSKLNNHRIEEKDDIDRLRDEMNLTTSPSVHVKYSANTTVSKVFNVFSGRKNTCDSKLVKLMSTQSDDSSDSERSRTACNSLLITSTTPPSECTVDNLQMQRQGEAYRGRNNSIAVTSANYIKIKSHGKRHFSPRTNNHSQSTDTEGDESLKNTLAYRKSVKSSLLKGTYSLLIPSTSVSSQESQLSTESIFPINCSLTSGQCDFEDECKHVKRFPAASCYLSDDTFIRTHLPIDGRSGEADSTM